MTKELIKEYANRQYPISGDYNTHRYGNDRMNEYIVKSTAEAIRISDDIILGFGKPSIETRFCFHDEGPQYDLYKDLHSDDDKMKAYFMRENLRRYDEYIRALENPDSIDDNAYVGFYDNKDGTASMTFRYRHNFREEPNFTIATGKDKQAALEAIKQIRAAFVKRLETWWKRYGAEKLHTWTYWADA